MSENLEGIVVDVSKMETTAPTREKSSAVGNAAAKHQFREIAKMIPHEEVSVSEMQQSFQPVTDCHGLNDAATRKALESVRNWCLNRLVNASYQVTVEGLLSVVNSALAAPPRNCDVGTTYEQDNRFNSFCKTHLSGIRGMCSPQCPCIGCRGMCHCLTKWEQMPYEEVKK